MHRWGKKRGEEINNWNPIDLSIKVDPDTLPTKNMTPEQEWEYYRKELFSFDNDSGDVNKPVPDETKQEK